MAKNIKETLLGTLVHGQEVLENIDVMRKVGFDHISKETVTKASDLLHPKELNLVVSDIIETDKNAKIIRLSSENGWLPPFVAGQYINLFLEIDGVRTSRPYSISSSPNQRGYYEITVARVKDGFASVYLNDNISIGDTFTANGPAGNFTYNGCFHKEKSLYLAGGSGITPFMSMIREIVESGKNRDIVLLYGCREKEMAYYQSELIAAQEKYPNFKYHLVLSGDDTYEGPKGFIDGNLIKELVPDFAERTAYICGPQVMNEFCRHELENLGLARKQIRREMFGASGDISKAPGWPSQVAVDDEFDVTVGDKVIKAKAGEPLLVALERAGIRVNVCCRSGECSLCRVKLVSGKVFMAEGMLRRFADEKYGYIHSCKAYPIGNVEIQL